MKKLTALISAAALCGALLPGCAGENEGQMDIVSLGLLPEGYTAEQAAEDGCFVAASLDTDYPEGIIAGFDLWEEFLERAEAGEPAFIRMIFDYGYDPPDHADQSTGEDPVTRSMGSYDVLYDGSTYTVYTNGIGKENGGPDLQGRNFHYLLRLQDERDPNTTWYILSEDPDLTIEEYKRLHPFAPPSYTPPEEAVKRLACMRIFTLTVPSDVAE